MKKETTPLQGITRPEQERIVMAGFSSHINEMHLVKYAEFMHGIRCAFEFIGYKRAIPIQKCQFSEVYQRAVFNLIMENNINLHDYMTDRYDIRFKDHKRDKRGRLVSVVAYFDRPSSSENRQKKE